MELFLSSQEKMSLLSKPQILLHAAQIIIIVVPDFKYTETMAIILEFIMRGCFLY